MITIEKMREIISSKLKGLRNQDIQALRKSYKRVLANKKVKNKSST